MSSVKVENIILKNDQIASCLVIIDNTKYEVVHKDKDDYDINLQFPSASKVTLETTPKSNTQQKLKLEKAIDNIVQQLKEGK